MRIVLCGVSAGCLRDLVGYRPTLEADFSLTEKLLSFIAFLFRTALHVKFRYNHYFALFSRITRNVRFTFFFPINRPTCFVKLFRYY